MSITSLRADAEAMWTAALRAVDPHRLVSDRLVIDASGRLALASEGPADGDPNVASGFGGFQLDDVDRIVVVGGGKAAAGLATGLAAVFGDAVLRRHDVTGIVSVPEGCGRGCGRIEIRETRPAASNLPTPAVVEATEAMLATLSQLGPRDLAIALVTGGGSALMAAPATGVTLAEKIAVTRQLSESGADIATLNAARRRLSRVKGGGLATACTAGRLLVLVLSDVLGNDLDVIASGPCMPPVPTAPPGCWTTPRGCRVRHLVLGDNGTAVAAAAGAALRAGYTLVPDAIPPGAAADSVGRAMATIGRSLLTRTSRDDRPRAIVCGGEATVRVPADHGTGGRNQQTVLAALVQVQHDLGGWPDGLLLASIGTDGEDGPTDAAGALVDAGVAAAAASGPLEVTTALARCDAYPLLDRAGGLVRTGPTGTNVADVRILLAE